MIEMREKCHNPKALPPQIFNGDVYLGVNNNSLIITYLPQGIRSNIVYCDYKFTTDLALVVI